MGGGFNLPAGQQSGRGQPPPRSISHVGVSTSTGSGTSSSLKRTAEVMQCVSYARSGTRFEHVLGGLLRWIVLYDEWSSCRAWASRL
ncbi:hypothetical protein BD310DRAFT_938818 [Dichomitus squalens]|uniref:Uncharacterized protein n=1 Tax=Dichomitus squalens TaxID=114155 RepID=A0A4Q9PHE6_9APHY|nr:hypothetical protein BD310DRAFT_938818 [Dichomitus squalens]